MIKILHVISDIGIGGAGVWVLNLIDNIDRTRFKIEVAIPEGSLLKQPIEQAGINTITIPDASETSLDFKTLGFLYRTIKDRKIDIVHTHASLSARIAAKIAGAKGVVHTKHCIDEISGSTVGKFKRYMTGLANNYLSDMVTAVSQAVRDNLIEASVQAKKIEVIYNGIKELKALDTKERTEIRNLLGITDSDVVIGIFARLEAVKGHDCFLEAAKLVSSKIDNVKFIIVGTGTLENHLKETVKNFGIEDKTIFTGYLEDITKVMNIVDINIISSVSEALCLSLIEGMSLSKPSVATNTGGIPEVVADGENGFLVPVNSPEKMSEAILKLCRDLELRNKMGEDGKVKMKAKFSIDEMIKKIEAVYEKLGGNSNEAN